jgi:predicted sulfurtransferase
MPTFTNAAAYKFAPLDDLRELRTILLDQCLADAVRGTILLSPEGINFFVAAERPAIDRLLHRLRAIEGLAALAPKFSESDHQPFTRMLVRLKREIIAFGVPGIDPATHTVPRIAPTELKRWLDEGRPVTLLDTRNTFETDLGTFANARTLDLDRFRNFPQAAATLPETLKDQPVVTFCTGGIRCEKAAPFLETLGFTNVLQLDGGILKYFEECGDAHYDGECFVFDKRVAVDTTLRETGAALCFACQMPVTIDQQSDPRYLPNVSCPHCAQPI